MADTDTTPDTPKPAARRRSTTPAKAAAKPRAKKPAADAPAAAEKASKPKAPPKPRSTKRTNTTRKPAKSSGVVRTATEKVGGKWGAAAIAGGLAAAGAAAAALLTLRGSTAKPTDPATPDKGEKAHQPDGTDSSKSFQAGIADENTVPDKA